MDDATYKKWWPLHIKNAKGEALTSEKQTAYEKGRDQLYPDEDLSGNVDELKRLRTHVHEMEMQLAQMLEQYCAAMV